MFAEKPKAKRCAAGLMQGQLADLCGLERSYISRLERRPPTLDTLEVIALALQIDAEALRPLSHASS